MAAAKKDRWQATIRTLWAIAKSPELHMDSEDLHAVVYRETGKDSLKNLSQNDLNQVASVLQKMKDSASGQKRPKRTDESGDPRTAAQRRKIHALCEALGWNDNPKRIQGFVRRMTKIDRIEWLDHKQCAVVIEALKKMAERKEGAQDGKKEVQTPDAAGEGRTGGITEAAP